MRCLIAAMFFVGFSISALGQDDPRSTAYDRHLMITDSGLLDTQKRTLVLDLGALESSVEVAAREYFDVGKLNAARETCGSVGTIFAPHYELRKAGRVYACVQLASLPALVPPQTGPTAIMPDTLDRILFVGPLCDRAGGCPGMLLTEIPKFSPMRDCGTAEGMVVCNPKYVEKNHVYYDIQSCNREIRTSMDELQVFKRKRGKFRLCSIDIY